VEAPYPVQKIIFQDLTLSFDPQFPSLAATARMASVITPSRASSIWVLISLLLFCHHPRWHKKSPQRDLGGFPKTQYGLLRTRIPFFFRQVF
jgi:hypothetical protein